MSELINPPSTYTKHQWDENNEYMYNYADDNRKKTQHLSAESDRLISETHLNSLRAMNDVDKKLELRLNDLNHWRKELDDKLKDLNQETDKLDEYFRRLVLAQESLAEPLHVSEECLRLRGNRKEIEKVHDDVQKNLMKEVELYNGIKGLLHRVNEQAKEQIRLNRKAIFHLNEDLSDKETAIGLDESTKEMDEHKFKTLGSRCEGLKKCHVSPEEWIESTIKSHGNAEKQLQNSKNIRSLLDGVLKQVGTDQQKQFAQTNAEFKLRISETRAAKGQLEERHAKILEEISNIEDNMADLCKEIDEREASLNLTLARLSTRDCRPRVEKVRDEVTLKLEAQVKQLRCDISRLRQRHHEADVQLHNLRRLQLELGQDIDWKEKTIFIDDVECMTMRSSIKLTAF